MSIFLDPTIVPPPALAPEHREQFPTSTHFVDRNATPTECDAGDCAPLPGQGLQQTAFQGPGCIIIQSGGEVCAQPAPVKTSAASQLTNQLADNAYINNVALQQLNMGGANACIFKLLGVHQQGTLIDAAGFGTAIASDFIADFPPRNAFDRFSTHWVSDTNSKDAWIGYDFGVVKRENGLQQYLTKRMRKLVNILPALRSSKAAQNKTVYHVLVLSVVMMVFVGLVLM